MVRCIERRCHPAPLQGKALRAHRRPDRKSARAASYGARPPSVSGDVAAYLVCVWALAFAAVHLYWAVLWAYRRA